MPRMRLRRSCAARDNFLADKVPWPHKNGRSIGFIALSTARFLVQSFRLAWDEPDSYRRFTRPDGSFDRDRIYRRAASVNQFQRSSREQEGVLFVLGAVLGQILQPYDFVEYHAEIAQQRGMKNSEAASLFVEALLATDRIGGNRRNLHLIPPLHQLLAVL